MGVYSDDQLAEIDRNARAYGFEIGRGKPLAVRIDTSEDNPFLEKNWHKLVESNPEGEQMPSMTPLRRVVVQETLIFTEDWSGDLYQQGHGTDKDNAYWMGWSIARAHGVELMVIKSETPPPVTMQNENLPPEPKMAGVREMPLLDATDAVAPDTSPSDGLSQPDPTAPLH